MLRLRIEWGHIRDAPRVNLDDRKGTRSLSIKGEKIFARQYHCGKTHRDFSPFRGENVIK